MRSVVRAGKHYKTVQSFHGTDTVVIIEDPCMSTTVEGEAKWKTCKFHIALFRACSGKRIDFGVKVRNMGTGKANWGRIFLDSTMGEI